MWALFRVWFRVSGFTGLGFHLGFRRSHSHAAGKAPHSALDLHYRSGWHKQRSQQHRRHHRYQTYEASVKHVIEPSNPSCRDICPLFQNKCSKLLTNGTCYRCSSGQNGPYSHAAVCSAKNKFLHCPRMQQRSCVHSCRYKFLPRRNSSPVHAYKCHAEEGESSPYKLPHAEINSLSGACFIWGLGFRERGVF